MSEILDEHLFEEKEKQERRNKVYYVLLTLVLCGFIISSLVAWYEVESIIGSGPIMSILGIIFARIAYKIADNISVFLGLTPLVISIIWYSLIEMYDLSPGESEFIIPLSLSIVTVFVIIIGLEIFRKRKPSNRL